MRRRILLADDSVTIQKVIELTFMDEDYEVRAVSNGDEAIQALPEVDPDMVIADVHMPGANGYEVCRSSKARRPEVPVLLLVGTFEPFDEAQARAAGASSFLKKPFDSQELLQRVADLMASAGPAAAAPPMPAMPAMPSMPTGAETVYTPLPSLSTPAFESAPASQPVEEWKGFELSPEPELSSPFSFGATGGAGSSFSLEEPTPDWQSASASVPDGEPMFELEEEPAPLPSSAFAPGYLETLETPETPEPAGDVFGFDPQPLTAAPAFDTYSDTERLGVPETAAPLVSSLEETERRIEAPAPLSLDQSHEPQAPARMAVPETPSTAQAYATPLNGQITDSVLSDSDVDRIARRVVELLGDRTVRDVAWEVIPDLAEVVIRDRLRELESQAESLE
jgi:CheY-like chemotaxis protein